MVCLLFDVAAEDFDAAVHDLIKKYVTEHQRIVFNGNGYSGEWVEEAERRGLPNIKTMVDAIPAIVTKKAVNLYKRFGIFTETELKSRAEIKYEEYAKLVNIEACTMIDMASKSIIPACIRYGKCLADTVIAIKAADSDFSVAKERLDEITALISDSQNGLSKLIDDVNKATLLRFKKVEDFVTPEALIIHEQKALHPLNMSAGSYAGMFYLDVSSGASTADSLVGFSDWR